MAISYGNDLRDGSIYGQGLATIALSEAYGMTHDPMLLEPAQSGIKFILWAQDPKGGGWRYTPGEPGDTTVTGWMLMALRSGQMAGLDVPSPSILDTERFLSSVQNEDGSQYGYMTRQPRKTTTAVGLLCRMYTGWRRDNPGLIKGVAHLSAWGPSRDDIYFDYYATQVLFHWAGPEWNVWNNKMRDMLISTQGRGGHETGRLVFRRQAWRGGRTTLQHVRGHHDPRSLLPLHAAVFRKRRGREVLASPVLIPRQAGATAGLSSSAALGFCPLFASKGVT